MTSSAGFSAVIALSLAPRDDGIAWNLSGSTIFLRDRSLLGGDLPTAKHYVARTHSE